ncbi:copper chaperone PCu(A)C [Marinospirillum alkaliphilum]|uniref:Copper(I)-binding protein n=1 Tax=Marinospirillum alkaliphilum DSM 21637 TaxID=1122209 RepID=A0A1K1UFP7_9GAMM|nr:copper chaperone PCu(A)C [Marinospirillum alkaliphilum]SFX11251.1 hypothetical protein SAMN02745752_00583 [Marinospirillum alkaliphilum DSM 21637]
MKNKYTALLLLTISLFSFNLTAADLLIEQAYVRAVPPTSEVTAAFMLLKNNGNKDLALVDVSSPASRVMELHTHTEVDGVMQMRRVDRIEVPAGGQTHLKPGGLHLMLIGLKQPLTADDRVDITLTLDDGSLIELNLPVRHMQMQHQHRH